MNQRQSIQHEFVTSLPDVLEDGKVYVSLKFATAAHKCMCGCGLEVVTPIRPTDWQVSFNGESISLHPSIGNWGFPCQSHYWIRNNAVIWAGRMTEAQIQRGRTYDKFAKENYFGEKLTPQAPDSMTPSSTPKKNGFIALVKRWVL